MWFRFAASISWMYPHLLWRIPTVEKEIYLTFDDGPTPEVTEFVLDALKAHHAKATFFCLGKNAVAHHELFASVQAEGHTVGNHTHRHLKGWGCPTQEYVADALSCQHTMPCAKLFRPPYGKISRKQINALVGLGFRIVMWDVLSFDFARRFSAAQCLLGTIGATRPGSIVVFHDSYKAEELLRFILPRYLEHFSAKGFSFKAIPNA